MKTDFPGELQGSSGDPRETAEEAAPHRPFADPEEDSPPGENLTDVHGRLDELTRQLGRLTQTATNRGLVPPPPGRGGRPETEPDHVAEAITRLDRRLEQLVAEGRTVSSNTDRRLEQLAAESRATADSTDRRLQLLAMENRAVAEKAARLEALRAEAKAACDSPRRDPEPITDSGAASDNIRRRLEQLSVKSPATSDTAGRSPEPPAAKPIAESPTASGTSARKPEPLIVERPAVADTADRRFERLLGKSPAAEAPSRSPDLPVEKPVAASPAISDASARSPEPLLAERPAVSDTADRRLERLMAKSRAASDNAAPPAQPIAASPAVSDATDPHLEQLIAESRAVPDNTEPHREKPMAQAPTIPDTTDWSSDRLVAEEPLAPTAEQPAACADAGLAAPPDDGLTDIDRALAEITARRRALDAEPVAPLPAYIPSPAIAPPAPRQANKPAQTAGQSYSGLERHLRHITTQIEALQQPRLEEAVDALRHELGEIARTLTEALPRRAVEALETEVRTLAGRFDNSRNFGVDAPTLAAVKQGLAEVRDALRALTPAESLVGFPEAAKVLSEKIDLLAATTPDPAAFQQLEAAITTLRGIVSHVASNEALAQLAGEVHGLAVKIDQVTSSSGGNALAVLEQRISHIADALDKRVQNGGTVPPQLETVIKGLSDKIERIQLTRGDQAALGHLEDRIVKLVEKLDASGARFSQLEAIERGLADLLVHLETPGSIAPSAPSAINVDGLQHDIARTQNSLEAVHGTLGQVVDRLALIETDMRGAPRTAPAMPQPAPLAASTPGVRTPPPASAPSPAPSRAAAAATAAAAMARANPQIAQRVIDPNLPPDQPLEPGTGIGRGRISTPAERIAASEADLGRAKPPIIPDPGGKSDFIAAARRAAQAAAADPLPGDRHAAADPQSGDDDTLGKKIAHRMRSLFVGVSVVLIAGGALHVTLNLLDSADRPEAPAVTRAENAAPGTKPADFIAALPAAPAPKTTESADNAGHMNVLPDITGSIQSPTLLSPPEGTSPRPPGGDKLPVAIGGPALRMAAAAGNAAAEYEVGVRYAEGRGVALNPAEAARWFEYGARQGLAPAQFRLAGLYEKGTGMKKDLEAARRLYLAAAEKGHAKAMHNLAVLYAEGGAAKPDYRMALQWFRKAADYGVSDSQYNLAILYARGIGVEQNLVESYKWFSIAATAGDPEAVKKRDEIGSRLDAQSLTAARAAAQAWTAQPQPEEATRVDPPPGGWDAATSSNPAPKPKSRASSPIKIGGI